MKHTTRPADTALDRPPCVLVVDDEAINVETLAWMLREAGFEILRAGSGPEGRRLAGEFLPDLVILDIMMPGESGFETCTRLTADPVTTDIPVVFISGLDDVENKVKGLKLGAVDYIAKPFAREEVLARVKIHIRQRRALRALLAQQAAKLDQIRDAQQSILVAPADMPEARFAISYVPVLEAGGDFYDVFRWTESVMGYFVADISGHDLGASFVTSSLKVLLRQNSGPLFSPVETLKNMNSVLASLFRDGKHLTAALLCLNRNRGRLVLVSAGHPPPIHVGRDGQATLLAADGDILGAFETVQFGVLERPVARGDRIYLYTDGLVERYGQEARSRALGVAELMENCRHVSHLPLAESVAAITDENQGPDKRPEDDMVLLGIEV
jgi:sigma-B regulation protein RsbU (phosphoserine phosphatase)